MEDKKYLNIRFDKSFDETNERDEDEVCFYWLVFLMILKKTNILTDLAYWDFLDMYDARCDCLSVEITEDDCNGVHSAVEMIQILLSDMNPEIIISREPAYIRKKIRPIPGI